MSCQYKYKSGIRKGTKCSKKSKDKYCKIHASIIKGQRTKAFRKKVKDKQTTKKNNNNKIIVKIPPKSKSTIDIGIGTSSGTDLLSSLLFDSIMPPLPFSLRKRIKELEDKKRALQEAIEEKEDPNIIKPTEIKFDVDSNQLQNINGLLKVIELYKDRPIDKEEETINYDLEKLCRIEPNLKELNNMIGIHEIKNKICDMIIYLCQKHTKLTDIAHNEYLHTVLEGPPGCGKTTLAKILAQIYKKLGFLKNGNLVVAKRSDLIGKYCGHTALLTQSIIDEAKGGVLFIDEAYSLGNKNDDPDAFSRECIDTLNQNLSEKHDFICIIAGYRNELDRRFFAVNPGLARRFPWVFEIKEYNSKELEQMFKLKLKDLGYTMDDGALDERFFVKNKDNFPFFGGSIHTFVNKIKIYNYKRLFGRLKKENTITKEDIEFGYKMYESTEKGNLLVQKNKPPPGMYC